jgi:hypothetical protein
MSVLSKNGIISSNTKWIDLRRNVGGLVISDMNMSVKT